MILGAFAAALGQLGDRRFMRVVLLGLLLAMALLVALYGLLLLAVMLITPDTLVLPWFGPIGGLHSLLGWASLGLMLLLSVFLMQPAALAFAGLFVDDVADAVEARHYRWLPPGRRLGLSESVLQSLQLIGLMLVVNLALLVFAAGLGPLAVPAFYLANGYLLGREYFTLVAARRLSWPALRQLRRRHGLQIWMAGVLMAIPLTIPLLNLLIPVLGTATFTHLYHRIIAAELR